MLPRGLAFSPCFFHFFFGTFRNFHCSIQATCRIEKQGSWWISSTFTIAKTLKLKEHVNCFACFYQFGVHHFKWVFQKYAFQHFNNIFCSKKWFNIQCDLITVTGQSLMRRGIDELVSLAASSKGCWCLSLWFWKSLWSGSEATKRWLHDETPMTVFIVIFDVTREVVWYRWILPDATPRYCRGCPSKSGIFMLTRFTCIDLRSMQVVNGLEGFDLVWGFFLAFLAMENARRHLVGASWLGESEHKAHKAHIIKWPKRLKLFCQFRYRHSVYQQFVQEQRLRST